MNPPPTESLLQFADSLADIAFQIVADTKGEPVVARKDDGSDVTDTDLRIQEAMCVAIADQYPDHAVIGEEAADYLSQMPDPASQRFCWAIDPLDGTRNYVRGLPWYATSIALMDAGRPVVGVVANLVTGHRYLAAVGMGAHLGDKRLQISDRPLDGRTVVSVQPAKDGSTFAQAGEWLRKIITRNMGSTALHLAMLAAGNLDASYCVDCRIWDIAAGAIIVSEAGGIITDLEGLSIFPFDLALPADRVTPFVAGGRKTHAAIVACYQ